MAANTAPVFPRTAQDEWAGVAVTAANTTVDLTSGTSYLVATADATEGSRIDFLRIMPLGTNVATVLRVWVNNGLTTATAANNSLIDNITLPATTVSQTAALTRQQVDLDISLQAGHRLYVTLGTAIAAGVHVTAFGGKY
jgi:hypothetical protein